MPQSFDRFIKPISELQRVSERYDQLNDGCILPDMRVVVRLDAHRLGDWSRFPDTEYPCGEKVSQALVATAQDVMQSGMNCVLAMIHGDEILIYVDQKEFSNPRRRARTVSYFASAASSHFLLRFGLPVIFHTKIAELPSNERLVEYFMWQRRCSLRNAIMYELRQQLSKDGSPSEEIERYFQCSSEQDRVNRLREVGSPVSAMNLHRRYGSMVWWQRSVKTGGSSTTFLESHIGLPEDDSEFLSLLMERLRYTKIISSQTPIPANEIDSKVSSTEAAAPRRAAVRFTHEKGSKRNTLVLQMPGNYKT